MANRPIIITCGVFVLLVVGFLVYKYIQPETEIPVISIPLTIPEPERNLYLSLRPRRRLLYPSQPRERKLLRT